MAARLETLVGKLGFVDYWRAKDWPRFCHSTTGDYFVIGATFEVGPT
jgi:hypothetical protein